MIHPNDEGFGVLSDDLIHSLIAEQVRPTLAGGPALL